MILIDPLYLFDGDGLIVHFLLPVEYFELRPVEQKAMLKEIHTHIELHNKLQ